MCINLSKCYRPSLQLLKIDVFRALWSESKQFVCVQVLVFINGAVYFFPCLDQSLPCLYEVCTPFLSIFLCLSSVQNMTMILPCKGLGSFLSCYYEHTLIFQDCYFYYLDILSCVNEQLNICWGHQDQCLYLLVFWIDSCFLDGKIRLLMLFRWKNKLFMLFGGTRN